MAYIGEVTLDLKDIQVRDKLISFKKGERFIARDGILHNQIAAGNIKVLVEIKNFEATEKKFLIFEKESEEIKNQIETFVKLNDAQAVGSLHSESSALKKELKNKEDEITSKEKEIKELKEKLEALVKDKDKDKEKKKDKQEDK